MGKVKNGSAKRSPQQSDEVLNPIHEYMRQDAELHPPPPPPLSPGQQKQFVLELLFPFLFSRALGCKELEARGVYLFMQSFIKEAGSPTDPLERMLLEQIALAHFRIASLHGSAGETKDRDAVEAYSGAAARLTGELRRLVLTMQEFRERKAAMRSGAEADCAHGPATASGPVLPSPVPAKPVEASEQRGKKNGYDTEQGSNGDHRCSAKTAAQPTARGSREDQSHEAWANHGGRTRTPAPMRPSQSPVGKVDGTTDGGGKGKGGRKPRQKAKGDRVREAVTGRVG